MADGVLRVDPPKRTSNPKVLFCAAAISKALPRSAADESARAARSATGAEAPSSSQGLGAGSRFVPVQPTPCAG